MSRRKAARSMSKHPDHPTGRGHRFVDPVLAAIRRIDRPSIGNAFRSRTRCAAEPSAIRSPIRDDDPCRHSQRLPAPSLCDLNAEPSPLIHPSNEFVDIDDVRLELDDQERSMPWMPGEDVDDPSLAEDRECDLRLERPFGKLAGEPPGNRLVKAGVSAADESIEVSATRSRELNVTWMSRARATTDRWSRVACARCGRARSARSCDGWTPTLLPTSVWRQPRRIRTARKRAPSC